MNRSSRYGFSFLSCVLALVLWAILSSWMSRPDLLPGPGEVFRMFVLMSTSGELPKAIEQSLIRICIGYVCGATLGVCTGLVLGRIKLFADSFGALFDFFKGIPPIALVPIVIIWLGIGEISKYVVIAYIVWVVVTISTAVGAGEIPLLRLRAGAFLGLSKFSIFWRIILPSVVPFVLIGLRSGIGFAFVALVSAELIAANSGIGKIIMDARFSLRTDRMIVGVMILGVVGATAQIGFDILVDRFAFLQRLKPTTK